LLQATTFVFVKSASSGKEREAVAAVAQPGAGDVDGEAFLHFSDDEEEEEGDRVARNRKGKRRKAANFGDSDEEQEQQQSL